MKGIRNIILLTSVGVLTVALIVVAVIFKSNGLQTADQTSSVRASNLTYTRELDLIAGVSPTPSSIIENPSPSPSVTIFPSVTSTASQTATVSATLSPTVYSSPTSSVIASGSATPTAIDSLPRTGWTQNVSIMFIAASVLMFLSFLF